MMIWNAGIGDVLKTAAQLKYLRVRQITARMALLVGKDGCEWRTIFCVDHAKKD
eukprot:m.1296294 g.1296294  ORF g.1296294 m.1296294 type:complete len:54 (+) comp24794_c0_seq12:4488-4649(+)